MTATPLLRLAFAASVASTLSLGAGCGGAGDGGDTTKPTITARSPDSNATDVSVNTTVTATFSEPMASTSIDGALAVRLSGGGVDVAGTWSTTSSSVTFTPAVPLDAYSFYRVQVAATAADLKGNALAGIREWYFTTGAPNTFRLLVNVTDPGGCWVGFGSAASGTSCGADCMDYEAGAVVSIIPACTTEGDGIASWGGACAGAPLDGNCVVTMDADRSADAVFQPLTRNLTLTTTGTGTGTVSESSSVGSCGLDCWTFTYGATVPLTPSANADSSFVSFGGDCTGATCSIVMTSARSVSARFDLKSYNVVVSPSAHGGYVATAGSGSCGANCNVYVHGTAVTVTASPDTGYSTSWSGPCSGTSGNSCTFSATSSATVGITFNPLPYNVTVTAGAGGKVGASLAGTSCGSDCFTYDFGTTVTFTAIPDAGYHVAGWSGACSGTGTTCSLSVTGAATVGVTFAINTYQVAVTKAGNGAAKGSVAFFPGGISCGTNCMTYDHATSVTIVPDVATGATFTGWSGDCTGTGDCVVSVTSAKAATATFTLETHAVTVTRSGAGSGSVASAPEGISCGATCSASFNYETSVTLTATPAVGSTFAGWSGACTGTGTCVVSVTGATSVDAKFDVAQYDVTVTKAGSGTGTVTSTPAGVTCGATCTGTYNYGTSVTLTAVADSTAVFTGWAGSGCTGTGTCAVTVNAATSVSATFQAKRTIGVTVSHLMADGLVLRNNGGDDLTLNTGSTSGSFATQVADGYPYAVTVFSQPTDGTQVCTVTGTSSGTVSADATVLVDCVNKVVATYSAAPIWNDYVKTADTATACDPAMTGGYRVCIHGGERRSVQTYDRATCTDLVAADALGAFDWSCDGTTNPVTFRSTGLKATKKLSDLIKWTVPIGFLPNSVTVTDTSTAAVVLTSASTVWWTNTFAVDNFTTPADGVIKVYTVPTVFSGSYTGSSGWSFVVKPGAYVTRSGTSTNGSIMTLGGDFIWWEGDFQSANGPASMLDIAGGRFAVVRGATLAVTSPGSAVGTLRLTNTYNADVSGVITNAASSTGVGIEIQGGGYNSVHDVVSRCSVAALEVTNSTANRIWNVTNQGSAGLSVVGAGATRNAFSHIVMSSMGGTGVSIQGGSDNVFTDLVLAGLPRGIWANGSSMTSNVFGHLTIANTTTAGIQLGSATNSFSFDKFTFFDVALASSSGAGLSADAALTFASLTNSRIHNLVSAHNAPNVSLTRANDNIFSGVLRVGGSGGADCTVAGGTLPGIDGACANVGASTATLSTGVGLGGGLVGSVTITDSVNPDNVDGLGNGSSWLFQNPFRTWGASSAALLFPDAAVRGRCLALPCRIYDWSLYAADPVMRNVDAPVASAGTVLTHTWADASTTVFLSGAIEVIGDGIGNDNGLCESNETCLYAPNVGAYQGHGSYGDAAVIDNGAVLNVTLKGYGTNGY